MVPRGGEDFWNRANDRHDDDCLFRLQSMGFRLAEARTALNASGGKLEQATDYLLNHDSTIDSPLKSTVKKTSMAELATVSTPPTAPTTKKNASFRVQSTQRRVSRRDRNRAGRAMLDYGRTGSLDSSDISFRHQHHNNNSLQRSATSDGIPARRSNTTSPKPPRHPTINTNLAAAPERIPRRHRTSYHVATRGRGSSIDTNNNNHTPSLGRSATSDSIPNRRSQQPPVFGRSSTSDGSSRRRASKAPVFGSSSTSDGSSRRRAGVSVDLLAEPASISSPFGRSGSL